LSTLLKQPASTPFSSNAWKQENKGIKKASGEWGSRSPREIHKESRLIAQDTHVADI
jgi:hypothetical protein